MFGVTVELNAACAYIMLDPPKFTPLVMVQVMVVLHFPLDLGPLPTIYGLQVGLLAVTASPLGAMARRATLESLELVDPALELDL